jgi:hypothetical protein
MEDRTFSAFHYNICSSVGRPSVEQLDRLRLLAKVNSIENGDRLSFRQLCKALDHKVDEQTRQREEIIDQCIDNTISLESIRNIPAPYFFSYKHNGNVFCDDIRDLYQFLLKDKSIQNPSTYHARDPHDRSPLDEETVDAIILKYHQVVPEQVVQEHHDVQVQHRPSFNDHSFRPSRSLFDVAIFNPAINGPVRAQQARRERNRQQRYNHLDHGHDVPIVPIANTLEDYYIDDNDLPRRSDGHILTRNEIGVLNRTHRGWRIRLNEQRDRRNREIRERMIEMGIDPDNETWLGPRP